MVNSCKVKRILLKLSGEMLLGSSAYGIDFTACEALARSLVRLVQSGIQVSLVIGGGNIFRGINLTGSGLSRTPADHMGMLATLMNGIALQQALEKQGCRSLVMTALPCPSVAETYNWHRAQQELALGTLLIFVGGTGNPYFTTDTAAALRASEIGADMFLKATKVDGVFDKDPKKYPDAKKFDTITYSEALALNVGVMDATALAMCRHAGVPILVFDMARLQSESIHDIVKRSNGKGTLVSEEKV